MVDAQLVEAGSPKATDTMEATDGAGATVAVGITAGALGWTVGMLGDAAGMTNTSG